MTLDLVLTRQQLPFTLPANQLIWRFVTARKADQTKLDQLKDAIQTNPGHRAGHYARHIGYDNKLVEAAEHILTQEQDERQVAILQTLVSCWIHGRSVFCGLPRQPNPTKRPKNLIHTRCCNMPGASGTPKSLNGVRCCLACEAGGGMWRC